MSLPAELHSLAEELQRYLAYSEMESASKSASHHGPALLVLRLRELKLKMYQEKGHALPHLHIDYGNRHHVASYSIEPTRCIQGGLDVRLGWTVEAWIAKHRQPLLNLWRALQDGGDAHQIVAELSGNDA